MYHLNLIAHPYPGQWHVHMYVYEPDAADRPVTVASTDVWLSSDWSAEDPLMEVLQAVERAVQKRLYG